MNLLQFWKAKNKLDRAFSTEAQLVKNSSEAELECGKSDVANSFLVTEQKDPPMFL